MGKRQGLGYFIILIAVYLTGRYCFSGENLVLNPGFEEGSKGWIQFDNKNPVSLNSEIVAGGKFSAVVKSNYDGLKQTKESAIKIEKGVGYLITAKVYSEDGRINILCAELDTNKVWLEQRSIPVGSSTKYKQWEEILGLYIPTDEKIGYIIIEVVSDKGGYVDDIKVIKQKKTDNMVFNPGFEEGPRGWVLGDNITPPALTRGFAHSGEAAAHLKSGELVKTNFYIPVERDRRYDVSAWIYLQERVAYLAVSSFNENKQWLRDKRVIIGTTKETGWTKISGEYIPPGGTRYVAVEVWGDTTIVVDDVVFSEHMPGEADMREGKISVFFSREVSFL
ncbi:MAG: hypothetical protein NC905_06265 [Candidatus Omnitrophica bacterium]|nr:hypothetical protein [Candidatus Omnitrophota bacterium]